jgi:multidrug efflux pump subunit AcrA (membrane-fusion protein)
MPNISEQDIVLDQQSISLNRYSEAVDELVSTRPPFMVRNGLAVLFTILLLLCALSYFIKYPTIVECAGVIRAHTSPKPIVAPQAGKLLSILPREGAVVQVGDIIGYIEQSADLTDVLELREQLELAISSITQNQLAMSVLKITNHNKLGDLQVAFEQFYPVLLSYKSNLHNNYYGRKQQLIAEEGGFLSAQNSQLQVQQVLTSKELASAAQDLEVAKKLFAEKVISASELRAEEQRYLSKTQAIPQHKAAVIANAATQHEKHTQLLDLQQEHNGMHLLYNKFMPCMQKCWNGNNGALCALVNLVS